MIVIVLMGAYCQGITVLGVGAVHIMWVEDGKPTIRWQILAVLSHNKPFLSRLLQYMQ